MEQKIIAFHSFEKRDIQLDAKIRHFNVKTEEIANNNPKSIREILAKMGLQEK
jgi:hypothetical protein